MQFYVTQAKTNEKEERKKIRRLERWPLQIPDRDILWAEGVSFKEIHQKGAVAIVTSRSSISARPFDADWSSCNSKSKTRRVRGFLGTP